MNYVCSYCGADVHPYDSSYSVSVDGDMEVVCGDCSEERLASKKPRAETWCGICFMVKVCNSLDDCQIIRDKQVVKICYPCYQMHSMGMEDEQIRNVRKLQRLVGL